MIRLLIVEDHPAIGAGLRVLLGEEPDLQLVGTVADVRSAAELIGEATPDVVLCDVMLDGENGGLELLKGPRDDKPAFLMFSAYTYPGNYRAALDAGAAGYLSKTATVDEIVRAIRLVASGGRAFPPEILATARGARARPTPRELQTITLVARGASNHEIAERLSIGPKTVESRMRTLFDRYAVSNRTELARVAEEEGWLAGDAS